MPQLSVITINYNNADGLDKTISSVLEQQYTDFELIVIDGGSDDKSIDVIERHADHISYWISEKDSGIYNAQNKGIERATGKYCLFLNSGDHLADADVLKTVFNEEQNNDIIYGDMITVNAAGVRKRMNMPEKVGVKRMLIDTLWHPVAFIKRELFSKYGKYDETYNIAADYDFFVRVIIDKKVTYRHLPLAISVFYKTGVSSDKSNKELLISERNRIQNNYFNPLLLFLFRIYSKLRN